jgi:cytidylate kinase
VNPGRFRWGQGVDLHPAERQGRWAEIRRQVQNLAERGGEAPTLHPFAAISREAGAGGKEVAVRLGELVHWRVMGKEILDEVGEELRLDPNMLSLLDEARLSWFGESVLSLVNSRLVSQDVYVERLIKVVLVSLSHGPAVIVGRGANAFLPPACGIAVRLVANEADRIARIRERGGLDETAARHWMHDADRARQSFIRHHFHLDPADSLGYDLTINTSRSGVDGAARLVIAGLTARGLFRPDAIG